MEMKSKPRSPSAGKALSLQEVLTAAAAVSKDLKKLAMTQPHHKEQMQETADKIRAQIQLQEDFQITHVDKDYFIKQSSRILTTLREALRAERTPPNKLHFKDQVQAAQRRSTSTGLTRSFINADREDQEARDKTIPSTTRRRRTVHSQHKTQARPRSSRSTSQTISHPTSFHEFKDQVHAAQRRSTSTSQTRSIINAD